MNFDKYYAEVEAMETLVESELTEEEAKYFKMYKKFARLLEREEAMAKAIYRRCIEEEAKEQLGVQ